VSPPRPRAGGSGFYAWLDRPPSGRAQQDAELAEAIRSSHAASDGAYGALRIHEDLKDEGFRVGKKRVARLMREHGVVGVSRRRGPRTTMRKAGDPKGPDLVQREFTADRPNALWVADPAPPRRAGTYVPTGSGFLYLAVVLDVFSRRIVGWAMAGHLRTELVLAALDMAVAQRKPDGVVHHSDHGCQYTSLGFGARCREAGVRPSLGSVGDCYDCDLRGARFRAPSGGAV
jgi:transposase InsO family protein